MYLATLSISIEGLLLRGMNLVAREDQGHWRQRPCWRWRWPQQNKSTCNSKKDILIIVLFFVVIYRGCPNWWRRGHQLLLRRYTIVVIWFCGFLFQTQVTVSKKHGELSGEMRGCLLDSEDLIGGSTWLYLINFLAYGVYVYSTKTSFRVWTALE